MSCKTEISNQVIIINNIITKKENKLYFFVGNNLDDNTKNILKKLENNKNITNTEQDIIKKLSPNWKLFLNNDIKIIYDYIRLDDSISYIKNKIFLYLSNLEKKNLLIEKNQELWIEKDNNYKILGYQYIDKETNELVEIEPSIYSKVEIDNNFVDNDGMSTNKYNIVNQDLILYDVIDILNSKEHIIYLSNLNDFIKRLEKHKIKTITDKLLNGYIKKYWPYAVIKPNYNEILNNYKNKKKNIERDNKIINLINNTKVDEEHFSNCNLGLSIIHINSNNNSNINLLKLYSFLRTKLNYNMPFIKYKDPLWDKPYSIVYDKALNEKKIDESTLMQWLEIGKYKDYKNIKYSNSITLKMKIYEHENNNYYGNITINQLGKIVFTTGYKDSYNATIYTLIDNINDLINIIKNINNSDALENKIKLPEIKFENNVLRTNDNIKIISLNTILNFKPTTNINHNDLYNFSKIFTPYTSYKLDKEQTETRITLLYKRISNFTNMSDIYKQINEQLQLGKSEMSILSYIVERFDISTKEATLLFSDFKKRHGGYQDYSLMKQTGITTCINLNKFNIHINGIQNFYLLVNVNKFITAMISIFENRAYVKNKDFRELILNSNDYIKLQEKNIQNDILLDNNNNSLENIANIDDIDDIDDFDDIDDIENDDINLIDLESENYLKIIGQNDVEELTNTGEFKSDYNADELANKIDIEKSIELNCEDAIPEFDTCKDLCNDRSYILRRLQKHDLKLFKYNKKNTKEDNYARLCGSNFDIQPIVMRHNPELDKNIDRESFTYALKYGSTSSNQNYYICPKVWCPYCQKPILYSKVKTIRTRMTLKGLCTVGTCPEGDHEVFIMTHKYYENEKYNKGGLFPGFVSQKHPDGYCLPCCFVKPQKNETSSKYKEYKKCLGEEVSNKGQEDNITYILGSSVNLSKGRYGLLSTSIAKLFNTECEQGFINKSCYLRKGTGYNIYNSFLLTIADIISDDEKIIDLDEIKEYLTNNITEELFKTLNGGSLELLFNLKDNDKSSLDNFKAFINSNQRIDEKYLWDYLSRPNVLYPEGLNIIIFTEDTIICPLGYNVNEFYNNNKNTIFIIKYPQYYAPIYYVNYDNKDISIKKMFSSLDKNVVNVLQILKKNCISMESINWKRILKDNEELYNIKYDIDIKDEFTLIQTIDYLKSIKTLKINKLIIDNYYKCIGVLLNNGVYIPVLPSSILLDYDVININEIKLLDYKTIIKNLNEIDKNTNINCKPIHKILSDNKIIAVILNTNRIVPVSPSPIVNDNIPIKNINYYPEADMSIHKNIKYVDKRIGTVNRLEYENESYNRIKYELSKYIVNRDELNEIKNIINSDDDYNKKKKSLNEIMDKIFKEIISTKDKTINFSEYITPNTRNTCYKNNECKDVHCIKDGDTCKLHIFSKNLLTGKDNIKQYKNILIEELLKNKMKRDEILDNNVTEIIDVKKIIPSKDEIIFLGKDSEDFEKLSKLYHQEKHIYINNIDPFDTLEPKFYGIDKEYQERLPLSFQEINLEPLTTHWNKILGNKYLVYRTKSDTLFDAFEKGVNYINMEEDKESISALKIRQNLSDYDVKEDLINIISKKLSINLYKDDDNKELLLNLYKNYEPKQYKDINSIPELKSYINKQSYSGNLIDIYILSHIYKLNVIILDSRLKKDSIGLRIIENKDSVYYMVLLSNFFKDKQIYNIIVNNGKYIYEKYNFDDRFRELINNYEEKNIVVDVRNKVPDKVEKSVIKIKKKNIPKVDNKKKIKLKKKYSPKLDNSKKHKIKLKK